MIAHQWSLASLRGLACLVLTIGALASLCPFCVAQEVNYGLESEGQLAKTAKPYAPKYFGDLEKLTRFGMAISEDNSECYFAVALNENGVFREEIRFIRRTEDGSWTKQFKTIESNSNPANVRETPCTRLVRLIG